MVAAALLSVRGTGYQLAAAQRLTEATALPAVAQTDYTAFLPLVAVGPLFKGTENRPLPPDSYVDDGNNPPLVAVDPTATACVSFIDITNFSDETLYIFWLGPNNEEFLYKILESGRHYWQHTYRFNEWRIRDDAARLIGTLVVSGCTNSAEDIFIDDLPPCGGILNIGLRNLATEEPIPGFSTLANGMTIDLRQLPPVIIHIAAQDTVESIEVLGGGAVVALNDLPFQYPQDGNAWSPNPGLYTLIFNAYRKDDAVGKICDSSELALIVQNNIVPTPTGTITATITATVTPLPTPTPLGTPALPTVTATPTATVIASCSGRIASIHLYNLETEQPVWPYTPLVNGMVLPLNLLPAQFNIDATLNGGVQSLLFTVNGVESLENAAPYRYPGGNINPWKPTPGSYTIQATAYALTNAAGAICDQQRITVTVVQTAPLPTATATPVVTPTPTTIPPFTPTSTPTPTATSTATPTPPSTPPATPGDLCIGNWTWRDLNENGLQDSDEPGLAGLDLYLWADDNRDGLPDRVLATTTSDAAGAYTFCGLQNTTSYLVEFGTNPQCRFTLRDQGNDEALDSDAEPIRGLSAPIQLTTGQSNNTVDAGYVCGT